MPSVPMLDQMFILVLNTTMILDTNLAYLLPLCPLFHIVLQVFLVFNLKDARRECK